MSGFDEGEIFYSDVFGSEDQQDQNQLTRTAAQKQFVKFIREFHEGTFAYPYRYGEYY
jgi:DNA replication licensing factor MCM5